MSTGACFSRAGLGRGGLPEENGKEIWGLLGRAGSAPEAGRLQDTAMARDGKGGAHGCPGRWAPQSPGGKAGGGASELQEL